MKTKLIVLTLCFSFLIFSCKKDERVFYGTWNVDKVQGQQYVNGVAGLFLTDNNPTGYVKFNRNGTGEQNYSFSILGATYPNNGSFLWEADNSFIYINRGTTDELIWRREVNEPNLQVATYNIVFSSSQNWDYTLTLTK